jgi:hypothetical protein
MSLSSITRGFYGAARLSYSLRAAGRVARSSRNLGQTYPGTKHCFVALGRLQVMDTKTQTVAVEMTFDEATKNQYVFVAPMGSAVEAIYVSKLAYAAQLRKVRVMIEVLE